MLGRWSSRTWPITQPRSQQGWRRADLHNGRVSRGRHEWRGVGGLVEAAPASQTLWQVRCAAMMRSRTTIRRLCQTVAMVVGACRGCHRCKRVPAADIGTPVVNYPRRSSASCVRNRYPRTSGTSPRRRADHEQLHPHDRGDRHPAGGGRDGTPAIYGGSGSSPTHSPPRPRGSIWCRPSRRSRCAATPSSAPSSTTPTPR